MLRSELKLEFGDSGRCIMGGLTENQVIEAFQASILYNVSALKRSVAELVVKVSEKVHMVALN